jgi:hypothetical protein
MWEVEMSISLTFKNIRELVRAAVELFPPEALTTGGECREVQQPDPGGRGASCILASRLGVPIGSCQGLKMWLGMNRLQ